MQKIPFLSGHIFKHSLSDVKNSKAIYIKDLLPVSHYTLVR